MTTALLIAAALAVAFFLGWDAADRTAWNRLDRIERTRADGYATVTAEHDRLMLDFFYSADGEPTIEAPRNE